MELLSEAHEEVLSMASAVPMNLVYELLGRTGRQQDDEALRRPAKRWRKPPRHRRQAPTTEDPPEDLYQLLAQSRHLPRLATARACRVRVVEAAIVAANEPPGIFESKRRARRWSPRKQKPNQAFAESVELSTRLEEAKRTLPVEYNNQADRTREREARLLGRFVEAWTVGLSGKIFDAWTTWSEFCAVRRAAEQAEAAIFIQAVARRWLAARRRALRRRVNAPVFVAVSERMRSTAEAARIIRKAMCRWRLRRRVYDVILVYKAAVRVQSRARRARAKARCSRELAAHNARRYAATQIQKIARRNAAKRVAARTRRQHRLRQSHARYCTISGTISYNFEQQGAAQRIQEWWAQLDWLVQARHERRVFVGANKITKALRNWFFRRALRQRVRARRRWKIAIIREEFRAVRRLQYQTRVFLDRRRAINAAQATVDYLRRTYSREIKAAVERAARAKVTKFLRLHPLAGRTLKKGIVRLQRCQRSQLFRRAEHKRRADEIVRFHRFLQTWARYRLLARKRRGAGIVIATRLGAVCRRFQLQTRSATRIATVWRRRTALRQYATKRHLMVVIARGLNPRVRAVAAALRVCRLVVTARRIAEQALAGKLMYERTREREIQRQVVLQATVLDTAHASELQRLFAFYCAYGHKGNAKRLGVGNFCRLAKETPGLVTTKQKRSGAMNKGGGVALTMTDVELIFMKARSKINDVVESHLHYKDFLVATRSLAAHVFGSGADSGATDEHFSTLVRHWLLKSKTGVGIVEELGPHAYGGRADARLAEMVTNITRAWRARFARRFVAAKRLDFLARLDELRRLRAVEILQRRRRGVAGRFAAARVARGLYEKLIDDELGREFWYNPRTHAAVWEKPKVLGWLDVPNPVAMPPPDRLFEVRCATCDKRSVTTFCIECEMLSCEQCKTETHARMRRGGKRVQHAFLQVEVCVQCRFQVGTKRCHQCKDDYCDTCFFDQHAWGSLQTHTYEELVPHCDECHEFAARTAVDEEGVRLCRRCVTTRPDVDDDARREVPYVPRVVKDQYERLENEKRRETLEREHAAREVLVRQQVAQEKVRKIQRVARGAICRTKLLAFLEERRAWLAQRAVDNKVRSHPLYHLVEFFGFAPLLSSDTDVEAVLKSVPFWARPSLRDVVLGKWTEFAARRREQRAHVQTHGRPSTRDLLGFLGATIRVVVERAGARVVASRARRRFERAQQRYRNARSANEPVEDSRATMRQRRQEYERWKGVVDRVDRRLDEIVRARAARLGPRRFWQHVREVRRAGHAVEGLTLSVERNSSFATVASSSGDFSLSNRPVVKPGDRIRVSVGDCGRSFRVVNNHGRPNLSDSIALQLRRAAVMFVRAITLAEDDDDDDSKTLPPLPTWTFDPADLDKLRLNATWTHETAADATARRYPRKRPLGAVLDLVADTIRASVLVQMPVKVEIAARCALRRQLELLASKVDEGSDAQRALLRRAERQRVACAARSQSLVRPFDGERGLGLLETLLKARWLASTLATLPARVARNEYEIYLEGRAARLDHYKRWDESNKKVPVAVDLCPVGGELTEPRTVGVVDVDLRIPVDEARECVRRALWRELNELGVGAAYDFVDGDVVEDESGTRLRRIVLERRHDGGLATCVLIAKSATRDKCDLEPYVPKPKSKYEKRQERRRRRHPDDDDDDEEDDDDDDEEDDDDDDEEDDDDSSEDYDLESSCR